MEADAELSLSVEVASLVARTLPVLLSVPQLAAVVVAVTWTFTEALGARVSVPQDRLTPVVTAQPVAVVPPASTLQLRPAGRVSVMVTPVAVPGPALTAVMVKPTPAPADTGVASAVLAARRFEQLTTMSIGPASAEPSLEVATCAELDTVPQVAAVVALVMWTCTSPPEPATSLGPQVNTPPLMAQEL